MVRKAVQPVGALGSPRLNESATSANTSGPVPGTGASQSAGTPVSASSGAASPASGAERAASWDAATNSGITRGSTSAETTVPMRALSPLAHNGNHRDAAADRNPVGGHRIARPPQRRLDLVGDQHHGLVGAAELGRLFQDEVDDLLRGDHRPPSVRVLSTLTPRNNADGQPWLTAATWPGWALPQLNAPPSRQVDGPPTASMEFQKSVVVA